MKSKVDWRELIGLNEMRVDRPINHNQQPVNLSGTLNWRGGQHYSFHSTNQFQRNSIQLNFFFIAFVSWNERKGIKKYYNSNLRLLKYLNNHWWVNEGMNEQINDCENILIGSAARQSAPLLHFISLQEWEMKLREERALRADAAWEWNGAEWVCFVGGYGRHSRTATSHKRNEQPHGAQPSLFSPFAEETRQIERKEGEMRAAQEKEMNLRNEWSKEFLSAASSIKIKDFVCRWNWLWLICPAALSLLSLIPPLACLYFSSFSSSLFVD